MDEAGFVRGVSCPVVFRHGVRDLVGVVHGGDFVFCGAEADLQWIAELLGSWFEIKIRAILGGDDRDAKEGVVLGRTIRWRPWGWEYEADRRHREVLLDCFGLGHGSKELKVNGCKEEEEESDEVSKEEATEYRSLVARLNYLSHDCPDLQFPAKELCKHMSKPTEQSWKRLKRTVRYVLGRERVVWKFVWQEWEKKLRVHRDSDWGGDRRTRKSTFGGILVWGRHPLKSWSSTQGAIALSSAEAKLYAMSEAVAKAKGVQNILKDMGVLSLEYDKVEVLSDSSAARSFVHRRGAGRMKHLDLRDLWLQKEVGDGRVQVRAIGGKENPADIFTKWQTVEEMIGLLKTVGISIVQHSNGPDRQIRSEGGC